MITTHNFGVKTVGIAMLQHSEVNLLRLVKNKWKKKFD